MSNILDVQPLTDRILMVHFKDGYVEHHKKGQPRSQEIVITDPLDLGAATRLMTRSIALVAHLWDWGARVRGRSLRGLWMLGSITVQ
jgi:hypothetical protein